MKFFKSNVVPVFFFGLVLFLFSRQFIGCTKEDPITETVTDTLYYDAVCPLRGTFVGTNTPSVGTPSGIVYTFQDNNFVVGRHTVGGAGVSFGGYRNTCDSVIWNVYYTVNSSYYLLKGKISNNGNTISGSFNNLTTTSDFGTFTMSK